MHRITWKNRSQSTMTEVWKRMCIWKLSKTSQFPEHLRMMFLHLWCVGLRISEVCTLKGDAYYIQNGDCWMKVYQVKMKNYKGFPFR